MFKKTTRILAMLLVVALLMSSTAAFAFTYSQPTKYRMVTCGDKLFGRRTTLYIKNTADRNDDHVNDLYVTITQHTDCGISRSSLWVPRGSTGEIKITTGFGKVGIVEFTVYKGTLCNTYSFSAWNTDHSPIVQIG